jgi:hypothetical protein
MGLRGPHARPLRKAGFSRVDGRPSRPRPPPDGRAELAKSAAGMRRYRARQREGKLVVNVELDEGDIATLVEARVLDGRRDDRAVLAQAVKVFLRVARKL